MSTQKVSNIINSLQNTTLKNHSTNKQDPDHRSSVLRAIAEHKNKNHNLTAPGPSHDWVEWVVYACEFWLQQ